ncbi:MAG: DMT family transporter [Proteobacteria bacterium]|nr:DMT family transporter [Pseudomonadota bacterium]
MGYLLAVTAIFFWSFNIIIASYFATSLQPFEIAFGRWFIAAFILVPLAWNGLRRNFRLLFENAWLVLALALTGIVWDNTLIYYAGHTASAINMGLLDVTGPIFLVVMSWMFLKTPIEAKQVIGLLIAVAGVLTIILRGDFTQLADFKFVSGDGLMLINTFCFAVYSLLQSKRPSQIDQATMLAATVIVGLIIIYPFMMTTVGISGLRHLQKIDFAVFFYLGIFNSVISYLAWNSALNKIGNIKTGVIYYLLPLFSGIEAYFILHEKIYASQIWGGLLIIFGIALTSLPKRSTKNPV